MRTLIVSLIAGRAACMSQPRRRPLRQVRVYEANVSSQTDAAVQAQAGVARRCWCAPPARAMPPTTRRSAGVLAQAQTLRARARARRRRGSAHHRGVRCRGAGARHRRRGPHASGRASVRCCSIVLTGGPATGAFETRRQVEGALDAAGDRRGQPISRGASRSAQPADCRRHSRRRGARGRAAHRAPTRVLVGYGDAVPTGGAWRWTLNAPGVSETWNGTLEEGVHGAADIFARNAQCIRGVARDLAFSWKSKACPTLKEYARVAEILGGAPAVCAACSSPKLPARARRSRC